MASLPVFGAFNPGSFYYKNPRSFSVAPVIHPTLSTTKAHAGDDWGTRGVVGVDIRAASDGVVVLNAVNPGGWGNYLVIEHTRTDGTPFRTLSGHMADRSSLAPGSIVKAGQVIGVAGETGQAQGIHLHFEIINGGGTIIPAGVIDRLDPATFTGLKGSASHYLWSNHATPLSGCSGSGKPRRNAIKHWILRNEKGKPSGLPFLS